MVQVTYASPSTPLSEQRHIVVVVHRDREGRERGYFFDSVKGDHGGSGPFDWNIDEAIERAKQFALDKQVPLVVVRAKAD